MAVGEDNLTQTDVTPESKAKVDPNFEQRLRDLRDAAKAEFTARQGDQPVKWNRPTDYEADLEDWDAMSDPFDRSAANGQFVEAVEDANNPGTTGDLVATTTQIDYLAVMERAFRARTTSTRPRMMAHLSGRKKGHGSDRGPLIQCTLEYVRSILRQGSV